MCYEYDGWKSHLHLGDKSFVLLNCSLVQMGHLSSNSPLTITGGEEAMESGTVFLSSRRHWNSYRFLETLCVLD